MPAAMPETLSKIMAGGRIGPEEVLAIRRAVYPDGHVSAAEAGWMFDLDAAAVLTKTTSAGITITGSYHQNPNSNTQRAVVALTAANLTISQRTYWWELKRTTSGSETRLAYGLLNVGQTVHLT